MKKFLILGLVILVSACAHNEPEQCCYENANRPVRTHRTSYAQRFNGCYEEAKVRETHCCQAQESVQSQQKKIIYKTVYEPQNYSSELCERKPYKTTDCTTTYVEKEERVRERPVVVNEYRTYRNGCSSCCGCSQQRTSCGGSCYAPEPKKLTCECSLR